MTLNANDARNEYTASAAQTVFNYTFKIYDSTDLDVYVTPSGADCSDADLTTSYTVSGVGNEAGGTITLTTPSAAGDLVTIVSSIPTSRTTDYQNNGDFRPDTVNDDFDRNYSLVKQIQDVANRSLQFSPCLQGATALSLPAPIAKNFLQWKSDLSGLENYEFTSGAATTDAYLVSYNTRTVGGYLDNQNVADYATLRTNLAAGDYVAGDVVTVTAPTCPHFVVEAIGSNIDNDGTIIVGGSFSAISSQRNDVNVKWFGATGDGLTDDTAAIQAAIDAAQVNGGGRVYIPAGNYLVSSQIDVADWYGAEALILYGDGYGAWNQDAGSSAESPTTRVFSATDAHNVFRIASTSQTIIRDIYIDDTAASRTSGHAIFCERDGDGIVGDDGNVTGVLIKGVGIKGFYDGIHTVRLQTSTIDQCFIEDCVRDGVRMNSSAAGAGTSCTVQNTFVKEVGQDCFSCYGMSYTEFANCAADAPDRYGYNLEGATRNNTSIVFNACGCEFGTSGGINIGSGNLGVVINGCGIGPIPGVMTISGKSGTFTASETITGGTSGATASIVKEVDSTTLRIKDITGTFSASETITGGTSSATATYGSLSVGNCITANSDVTIIGGYLQQASGYGVNIQSGNSASIVGTNFTSHYTGNVNANNKVSLINTNIADASLFGHSVATGANDADLVQRNAGMFRFLNNAGTTSANYGVRGGSTDDLTYEVPTAGDLHTFAFGGSNRMQMEEMNGAFVMRLLGEVSSDPGAPSANQARLYLKDSGGGKTQLAVRFNTGAVQVIATEP